MRLLDFEFFDFMGLELRELLDPVGPVTLTHLGKATKHVALGGVLAFLG